MIEKAMKNGSSLLNRMNKADSLEKKLFLLHQDRFVCECKKQIPKLFDFFLTLNPQDQLLLLIPIALGQGKQLFFSFENTPHQQKNVLALLLLLRDLENFYQEMGGIIGYHLAFLSQLQKESQPKENLLLEPFMYDLTEDRKQAEDLALQGIKALEDTAALFPMGGAGDRLGLVDPSTNEALPVACLPFMGHWLLEHLIREVMGLEECYYRMYGKKILIPIAIMTSEVKKNHERILHFLEKHHYFLRPKESFFLFQQMSVPLISADGDWGISSPLTLDVRPGGHGVLWKLMQEKGLFDWLINDHKKRFAFLRQINNPVGGMDLGYLPLLGIGSQGKKMGFASCPRKVGSAEGMNVFTQIQKGNIYEQGITNIEYTDFEKYNIKDQPNGKKYSVFPANTNILFVDLHAVKEALQKEPYPGLTINLKSTTNCYDTHDHLIQKKAGRIELMMQNIADCLKDPSLKPFKTKKEQKNLSTFLTYNHRRKTLSVTKKLFSLSEPIEGTPHGALFDYLQNCQELLSSFCKMDLPKDRNEQEFIEKGPSFFFFYHPALGPLFQDIAKKIQKGSLSLGSELILDLKDIQYHNVTLKGSLIITAEEEEWSSSLQPASVQMKNVTIQNQGIDSHADNLFWKGQIHRKEKLHIHLEKGSKLILENLTLIGDFSIHVPAHTTLYGYLKGKKLVFEKA